MKKFIVLILALNMYLGVFAQFTPGDTLKYRISLKDKAATDYSLQNRKSICLRNLSSGEKNRDCLLILPIYRFAGNM